MFVESNSKCKLLKQLKYFDSVKECEAKIAGKDEFIYEM